jgi:hypothetical protein
MRIKSSVGFVGAVCFAARAAAPRGAVHAERLVQAPIIAPTDMPMP